MISLAQQTIRSDHKGKKGKGSLSAWSTECFQDLGWKQTGVLSQTRINTHVGLLYIFLQVIDK